MEFSSGELSVILRSLRRQALILEAINGGATDESEDITAIATKTHMILSGTYGVRDIRND